MKSLLLITLMTVPALSHGAWQPDPDDPQQVAVDVSIKAFLEKNTGVQEYLDQAWGYAVFPRVVRVGVMWGGSFGKGLVIEGDQLVGQCSQSLLGLGAQLGFQTYKQIILFQTEEALRTFQEGRLEFQGRASLVFITAGAAANPSHLPEVAIFTLTEAGLMFEASAGPTKFTYTPIE